MVAIPVLLWPSSGQKVFALKKARAAGRKSQKGCHSDLGWDDYRGVIQTLDLPGAHMSPGTSLGAWAHMGTGKGAGAAAARLMLHVLSMMCLCRNAVCRKLRQCWRKEPLNTWDPTTGEPGAPPVGQKDDNSCCPTVCTIQKTGSEALSVSLLCHTLLLL